jgi:hypothetical protein
MWTSVNNQPEANRYTEHANLVPKTYQSLIQMRTSVTSDKHKTAENYPHHSLSLQAAKCLLCAPTFPFQIFSDEEG